MHQLDKNAQVPQIGHQQNDDGVNCNQLQPTAENVKMAMEGCMNPKIIERVGNLLYGPRYMSELSRALEVSRQTVLSWSRGPKKFIGKNKGWAPSPENVEAMKKLVQKRIEELKAVLKEM
jgi:hypothetical protein